MKGGLQQVNFLYEESKSTKKITIFFYLFLWGGGGGGGEGEGGTREKDFFSKNPNSKKKCFLEGVGRGLE